MDQFVCLLIFIRVVANGLSAWAIVSWHKSAGELLDIIQNRLAQCRSRYIPVNEKSKDVWSDEVPILVANFRIPQYSCKYFKERWQKAMKDNGVELPQAKIPRSLLSVRDQFC